MFIKEIVVSVGLLFSVNNSQTIVDKAISVDSLSTLVTAVQAADLVEALANDGEMTVFAPTNSAFSMIDAGTINFLLEEPGTPTLQRILLHHVIPMKLDSKSLIGKKTIRTLAGTELNVSVLNGRVLIGDAVVSSADIEASNGVVHVIDRVLMPPKEVDPVDLVLESAIDKGVPLFNNGMEKACADVYETALHSIVLLTDFKNNLQINRAFDSAIKEMDSSRRAWALRRIMDSILLEQMTAQPTSAKSPEVFTSTKVNLYDFDSRDQGNKWFTILDGVMGGLSTGYIDVNNGNLIFSGNTSLKNNGGFSSMRAPVSSTDVAKGDAIQLRVKGDGRTYILGTRSSAQMGGDSYWMRFNTEPGQWQTVTVPISDMERHYFGNKIAGRISPSNVKALEFYIYDKKSGQFRLEIDSIDVVSLEGDSSKLALLN